MQVIHTPGSDHSQPNELDGMLEVVVPTPTSQTTVIPTWLDLFLVIVVLTATPA
jgi:cell shape-determining protein MreD